MAEADGVEQRAIRSEVAQVLRTTLERIAFGRYRIVGHYHDARLRYRTVRPPPNRGLPMPALHPAAWLGLFGDDPVMLATGFHYLRAVGPFYGFFGAGLALYFAAQGAGRVGWPVAASLLRMVVALGGVWTASALGFGLTGTFLTVSAGFVVMGLVNAAAFATGRMIPRATFGKPSFGPLPLAPATKP